MSHGYIHDYMSATPCRTPTQDNFLKCTHKQHDKAKKYFVQYSVQQHDSRMEVLVLSSP